MSFTPILDAAGTAIGAAAIAHKPSVPPGSYESVVGDPVSPAATNGS